MSTEANQGPLRHGQQFNPKDPYVMPYTEQVLHYNESTGLCGVEGNDNTEISVIDRKGARVRVYDEAAIQADLDNLSWGPVASQIANLDLPDVLTGVSVVFNSNYGDGASSFPTTKQATVTIGSPGSAQLSPSASAQASGSITCDVHPTIVRTRAVNVPSTVFVFYQSDTQLSLADILTRVSGLLGDTVSAWPVFKPKSVNLSCKGQQLSLQQSARSRARVSWSDSSASAEKEYGDEYSRSTGVSLQTVVIPPTIHNAITLTGATQSHNLSVTVDASTLEVGGVGSGGAAHVDAIDNTPTPLTGTVAAEVTPTSITACSGLTSIPTSGWYLYRSEINATQTEFGRCIVVVELVNFAYFA